MKAVLVMVSGLATMAAGAFIRSCNTDIPDAFARAVCGDGPLPATHAHCEGCVMVAVGAIAAGLALAMIASRRLEAR